RERRARLPDLEGFDLQLALRRRPAGPGLALGLDRRLPCRQAKPRSGDLVVDDAPADLSLLGLGRGGEQGQLLRIEHAGFLELAIVLEGLDGGYGPVAALAIDQAVVVAGPGEIELDGNEVGMGRG